jgi:hypothetical protein
MPDLTACPLGYCTIRKPHPHPAIGEGLFGPNRRQEELREERTNTMTKLKVELVKVPCRCPKCHSPFEGLAFYPLPAGVTELARVCEMCDAATGVR